MNPGPCSAFLARLSLFDIDAIKNILSAHAPRAQQHIKLMLDGVAVNVTSARYSDRF